MRVCKLWYKEHLVVKVAIAITPFRELRGFPKFVNTISSIILCSNSYNSIQGIERYLGWEWHEVAGSVAIAITPFRELRVS